MAESVLSSEFNVYDTVTQKIIKALEEGVGGYRRPWQVEGAVALPVNASTCAQYRGINIVSLWLEAQARGYCSHLWASYKQWQTVGAQVRKGERGALVVFYKRIEITEREEEDHEQPCRQWHVARASHVFNATQVDGYQPPVELEGQRALFARIHEVEAFVAAVKADVRHGFNVARYRHDVDAIEMPSPEWFTGTDTSSPAETYYATLLHELTHWSGAPHRLNRMFGKRFGDQAYAMEELVAEFGAAFMCASFGISAEPRADHAAYIHNWLKVLKQDRKAIFTAASKAQEAFEHLAYLAALN